MDTPVVRATLFGVGCALLLFLASQMANSTDVTMVPEMQWTWEPEPPEEPETTTMAPEPEPETTTMEPTTMEPSTTTIAPKQEIRVVLEQAPPNVVVVREQMARPPLFTLQSPVFDEYAAA